MAGHLPILATRDHLNRVSTASTYDGNTAGTRIMTTRERSRTSDHSQIHDKLVFTDPVAFEYLAEDESTTVFSRRQVLEGYELFIVEQWAVSRQNPTFTICTSTPDLSKKVFADVLEVPKNTEKRSSRLKIYLEAISQSHAVEKKITIGGVELLLMVTNLNTFPATLNVIPVPTGDIRKQTKDFVVNEDLKRMGCMGRAAMSLQYPQASTITRFHTIYSTSVQIPLYASVTSVVQFTQQALHIYGKLDLSYADGLLCDKTESSITDWWSEIGVDFFNIEPSDGIFGATTVAALIGLLCGAFHRLKELNATIKDPMDVSGMKRAIGQFQKTNKMHRTRRLDRATLDRLHRLTANKADDEGNVTRALKSTVAGLSGKGGEMIARGLGGGKPKFSIDEVESLDIVKVAEFAAGRTLKWLWHGKDRGFSLNGPSDDLSGRVFSTDDQGNFIWTSSRKEASADSDLMNAIDPEDDERGPGRVREALHSRNHHNHSHSLQGNVKRDGPDLRISQDMSSARLPHQTSTEAFPLSGVTTAEPKTSRGNTVAEDLSQIPPKMRERSDTQRSHRRALRGIDHQDRESPSKRKAQAEISQIREELKDRKYQEFTGPVRIQQPIAKGLRRSISAIQLRGIKDGRTSKLPRHLSFSLISDAIESTREYELTIEQDTEEQSLTLAMRSENIRSKLQRVRNLSSKVTMVERALVPFAKSRVEKVEYLESDGLARLEELNNEYYQHLEEYQAMQATSTDLIAREKTRLTEALRSTELLGQKLDYEMDSLASRLQEVEESVDDFEHRVVEIETSVKMLIAEEEKDQRPPWYERWLPWTKSEVPGGNAEPK